MEEIPCKYLLLVYRFTSAKHVLSVVKLHLPSPTKPGLLGPLLPPSCHKQLQPNSPPCLLRRVTIAAALALVAVPKFLEALNGCLDAEGLLHCLVSRIIDVFERHPVLFLSYCVHDTWGWGECPSHPPKGAWHQLQSFQTLGGGGGHVGTQVSPWESSHSVL